jgi:2-succinyl-5-enolpyruvyl-6-hydroxy-3-cyclohexene-1-carboxylate synthase
MTASSPHPNQRWAEAFVCELAAAGLRTVNIAPGSRSTPLTLAFHRHPDVRVHLHLDERSAAFFALGEALAMDRPAALVCTSGTAAAEFFPAMVEARQAQVPLLVLTADRPHELRHSGANQTVDQVKLYGDQVLWSVDAALPAEGAPPLALRNLRTLAARAYATANGLRKGPVHINFPFRKPLEPDELQPAPLEPLASPAVAIERGTLQPDDALVKELADTLARHPYGLIVCGPRCPGGDFPAAVAALAEASGYPILADPLSGMRFGPQVAGGVIGGYDGVLASGGWQGAGGELEVVVRFGGVPTSKHLNAYLEASAPAHHILVRESGVWADDSHRVNRFMQVNEAALCRRVAGMLAGRQKPSFLKKLGFWTTAESLCWQATDAYLAEHFFDGAAVATTVEVIAGALAGDDNTAGGNLVIGNSLPVRHLDQFARPRRARIRVFGNRGASGIDGVTSAALGVAAATGQPTVLVIGDVSFVHDLNGLLAVGRLGLDNLVIVLLNNGGGGIFRRLPIAAHEPPFEELFFTPHALAFEHAARFYGLAYQRADDRDALAAHLQAALRQARPAIIEVRTDSVTDLAHQRAAIESVKRRIERGLSGLG